MIENLEIASKSQHERELTITIPRDCVDREFNKAVQSVQRVASRPGFRPGKMPKGMVLSLFGHEIKQKLTDSLIGKTFDEVLREKKLVPISKPLLESGEVDVNKAFTYKAIFQIKPEVPSPIYKGLKVEIAKHTFAQSDIADELNALRERSATFVEPNDRTTICDKDLVRCDCLVKIDGEINEEHSKKDYAIPLFADDLPPDLKNALLGKSVGDVASVKYMGKAEQEESKAHEMILTVNSFKERILPDLDDDFAKDISDRFNTLDELKETINLRLTQMARRRDASDKVEALTQALIKSNPLDVPSAMVERMSLHLLKQRLEELPKEIAKDLINSHALELVESLRAQAAHAVHADLLFERLIDDLKIEASEEEIAMRRADAKEISFDDARYSIQVEKLLTVIEAEADLSEMEKPLLKNG